MADANTFDKIRIGIASPDDIRSWSCGEVKKPETINYRTFKPERDGLFCERIFGPVKDWECHCGRYKKVKFKGVVCDRCGVEVTRSKVRRERMGHIELAAPVSHIWYLKGVPSPMSLLLDMSPRLLERVLYFASYIVISVDRKRINDNLETIRAAVNAVCEEINEKRDAEIAALRKEAAKEEKENPDWDDRKRAEAQKKLNERIKAEEREASEHIEELQSTLKLLETVQKKELITEDQYRALERLLEMISERTDLDMSGVFRAGLGGAAVKELLAEIDLEKLRRDLRKEIQQTTGPKRARAIKRLEIVEAFINSRSRPEWMILDCIPVISPELRPMVQLDGGRFATSDLNDLYRRIINRNNRLKKITEIRAPESIINHEKRLLQEAVDALIDNGRRTRPVVGSNNRPLKSLSDMLKGKEGRFRKNLLGKRVDYSGRSVIVVGPSLKLHQCGLPKEMALELFKPFVMKTLVEKKYTSNIKTAKRMIDRMRPEVWDALEEVICEHPVLLNRAPTLHRLGIQAFEPVLVDGKAIQVHPLVCHAFNADFDGDQMAVHVPLSASAQAEARVLMLSTHNLFSPADGRPIVAPIQDIVLGSFYMTMKKEDGRSGKELRTFANENDALIAYWSGLLDIHEPIRVRLPKNGGDGSAQSSNGQERELREITVGRLIFNSILPPNMRYIDREIDKKTMAKLITECYEKNGHERTIQLLDDLKELGFRYSTFAGITISMTDMDIPSKRDEIVQATQEAVAEKNRQYRRGLITQAERKQQVLELWTRASEEVAEALLGGLDPFNPIAIITTSGARGSQRQVTQLAGMRGLMSDPFGNLIEDLPIKSNFHEGLSVLEYFISTHGARKGLADTALRTADAGYLTRRLVDVAQDVIVRGHDCGTVNGIYVTQIEEGGDVIETLFERIRGRTALEDIYLPGQDEPFVRANELISDEQARAISEAGITRVGIRSPLTCELRQGICSMCYGRDMAIGRLVEAGTAVGIIAAQSIGEPGTQLTMRTFHTGGVAGKYLTGVAEVKKKKQESLRDLHEDIRRGLVSIEDGVEGMERERARAVQAVLKVLEDQVRGLLRVVELFEARKPKGQAIITEVAGKVHAIETRGLKRVIIHTEMPTHDPAALAGEVLVEAVVHPETGEVIAEAETELTEKIARRIKEAGVEVVKLRKTHLVPYRGNLEVEVGQEVQAGQVAL
ncbi:MAG: DNA-directed RNA polymerase subunit beta', partial [Armatimonadota bacterium]